MFATLSDMFSGRKSYGGEATRAESDRRGDHGQSPTFSWLEAGNVIETQGHKGDKEW
jgi:hypothetical protein